MFKTGIDIFMYAIITRLLVCIFENSDSTPPPVNSSSRIQGGFRTTRVSQFI